MLVFFKLCSSSFSAHASVKIKIQSKKKTRLCCYVCSLKDRVVMRFTAKTRGCLNVKFHPRLQEGTDRTYGHVTTKFSR